MARSHYITVFYCTDTGFAIRRGSAVEAISCNRESAEQLYRYCARLVYGATVHDIELPHSSQAFLLRCLGKTLFDALPKESIEVQHITTNISEDLCTSLMSLGYEQDITDDSFYDTFLQKEEAAIEFRDTSLYADTPCYIAECLAKNDYHMGKGFSQQTSTLSAIGEFLERHLASTPNYSEIRSSTIEELTPDSYFHPAAFSTCTLDVLMNDTPIDWVKGWSIQKNKSIWVPAEAVFFPYYALYGARVYYFQDTNGLSYHSNLCKGIRNSLCEVIEKDAYWTIMQGKMECPDIEIEALDLSPTIQAFVTDLQKQFYIHAKMITIDVPIPVVHILLEDKESLAPVFARGCSCSTIVEEAFEKALLEAIQIHTDLRKYIQKTATTHPSKKNANEEWISGNVRPHISHLMKSPDIQHDFSQVNNLVQTTKESTLRDFIKIIRNTGRDLIICAFYCSETNGYLIRSLIPDLTPINISGTRRTDRVRQLLKKHPTDNPLVHNNYPILT